MGQLGPADVSFDNPFFDEMAKYAIKFAIPVFFGESPYHSYSARLNSATATLVKLGDRFLAVTCHHVLEGLRRFSSGGNVVFYVGHEPLDPEEFLVDEDPDRDLAVLDITRLVGKPRFEESRFVEPGNWPPDRVTMRDTLCLAGFPGIWRDQKNLGHLRFHSFNSGAAEILSVSEDLITTTVKISECVVRAYEDKQFGALGGLSGGPVFAWRKKGVLTAELVGFVFEYDETFDLMRVRSASVIKTDGTITRRPLGT